MGHLITVATYVGLNLESSRDTNISAQLVGTVYA